MGEHAEIHVNAGKTLRGYKRKHPYPRKVQKAVHISPKIYKTQKYTLPQNTHLKKIHKIYWNINKQSPWQIPGALLLQLFSRKVIFPSVSPKYEFSMKFSK